MAPFLVPAINSSLEGETEIDITASLGGATELATSRF